VPLQTVLSDSTGWVGGVAGQIALVIVTLCPLDTVLPPPFVAVTV